MPIWKRKNGEFYSVCRLCRAEVKGTEEKKLGGSGVQGRTDIHFRCPKDGSHWWKDKQHLIQAIEGGYRNARGDWIRCDGDGRPLKGDLEAAQKKGESDREAIKATIERLKSQGRS